MGYRYFYTPCYNGPPIDSVTGLPSEGTTKEPGQDTGTGTEYVSPQPHGSTVLKYDDGLMRCVVRLLNTSAERPGWILKTSGEVLADYPGLPGVI